MFIACTTCVFGEYEYNINMCKNVTLPFIVNYPCVIMK